jgi:hypothetical protein
MHEFIQIMHIKQTHFGLPLVPLAELPLKEGANAVDFSLAAGASLTIPYPTQPALWCSSSFKRQLFPHTIIHYLSTLLGELGGCLAGVLAAVADSLVSFFFSSSADAIESVSSVPRAVAHEMMIDWVSAV